MIETRTNQEILSEFLEIYQEYFGPWETVFNIETIGARARMLAFATKFVGLDMIKVFEDVSINPNCGKKPRLQPFIQVLDVINKKREAFEREKERAILDKKETARRARIKLELEQNGECLKGCNAFLLKNKTGELYCPICERDKYVN